MVAERRRRRVVRAQQPERRLSGLQQDATFGKLAGAVRRGGAQAVPGQEAELAGMAKSRRRIAALNGTTSSPHGGGGSISFATGRPRDPFFYWRQNNLFYDFDDNTQLERVRKFCHLLYASHSLIGSCIDIYTKYPLLGMELRSKDDKLTDFYSDLFMSPKRLNYPKFLADMGRSYWLLGEAWPFGSFNEKLGIWEDEELLNPDDINVERSPFSREPRYLMKLPSTLRELLQSRAPAYEYNKLIQAYPELVRYQNDNELMPVSGILLRQLKFDGLLFNKRGIPLLNRALRPIVQEEMLNSAMDAIADRLYVPLLIAKLGASATDLGTTQPWIPTDDDMAAFEETADAALAADFRLLTTNFATTVESVFGREQMPDLTADFERIEDKILQTFGLSKTMLTGASSGETYAADALNRDLISQMLTSYQKMMSDHYEERALVVAEAQGHFDYDVRGGKKYVKMEEVLEVDEESGEERIVEQPKLLVPELRFKTLNLKDEEAERAFYEQLREAGVPISMKTRLINVPIDLQDEIEISQEEQVDLAVKEQETRKAIYLALKQKGLPIPPDLLADFGPQVNNMPQPADMASRVPMFGIDPLTDTPNLAPTAEDMAALPTEGTEVAGQPSQPVEPVAMIGLDGSVTPMGDAMAGQPQRPEESDEMRADMPKASMLNEASLWRKVKTMRTVVDEELGTVRQAIDYQRGLMVTASTGTDDEDEPVVPDLPTPGFTGPRHVGMRRYLGLTRDDVLEDY